jgi:hypothetical protein
MGLDKVKIKNERPGIMLTPGLRPPDDDGDEPEGTEGVASEAEDR